MIRHTFSLFLVKYNSRNKKIYIVGNKPIKAINKTLQIYNIVGTHLKTNFIILEIVNLYLNLIFKKCK